MKRFFRTAATVIGWIFLVPAMLRLFLHKILTIGGLLEFTGPVRILGTRLVYNPEGWFIFVIIWGAIGLFFLWLGGKLTS